MVYIIIYRRKKNLCAHPRLAFSPNIQQDPHSIICPIILPEQLLHPSLSLAISLKPH